jgi:hypothetical protein
MEKQITLSLNEYENLLQELGKYKKVAEEKVLYIEKELFNFLNNSLKILF